MGVIFSSHLMTVATTSVREDMAVALVETFGHHYEQIVLVGDPLFLKKFTDYARERGLDWSRYRVNAIIGEEVFGEHFRGYLAACLGLDLDQPDGATSCPRSAWASSDCICATRRRRPSACGARSLGQSRALRATCWESAATTARPLPMIFSFNPLRTFIEVVDPDVDGYGRMTTSMLDPERSVPLLRYQTGDIVRLLDHAQVADLARRHGVTLAPILPPALLALRGREREALPNGSHVALLQGRAVCRSSDCAPPDRRLPPDVFRRTVHDARPAGAVADGDARLSRTGHPATPCRPTCGRTRWCSGPTRSFPFGMSLDYERKFAHYVPGEQDPVEDGAVPQP